MKISVFLLSVSIFLCNLVVIHHSDRLDTLEKRVSALENQNKGSVTATLEPIPEVIPIKTPELYNNKTRILFNDKKEFECLARNIYYESRGEGYIGKISVAQVTFNRAEKVGSFCEVVHKPKQFSWTLIKRLKAPVGKEWQAARHAARMFSRGVRVSNLEVADHYHTSGVNPIWDNGMTKTATIGNHIFYASR